MSISAALPADPWTRGRRIDREEALTGFAPFPVGDRASGDVIDPAGPFFSVLVAKPDIVDLAHDAIELHSDLDLSLRRCVHCLIDQRCSSVQQSEQLSCFMTHSRHTSESSRGFIGGLLSRR